MPHLSSFVRKGGGKIFDFGGGFDKSNRISFLYFLKTLQKLINLLPIKSILVPLNFARKIKAYLSRADVWFFSFCGYRLELVLRQRFSLIAFFSKMQENDISSIL